MRAYLLTSLIIITLITLSTLVYLPSSAQLSSSTNIIVKKSVQLSFSGMINTTSYFHLDNIKIPYKVSSIKRFNNTLATFELTNWPSRYVSIVFVNDTTVAYLFNSTTDKAIIYSHGIYKGTYDITRTYSFNRTVITERIKVTAFLTPLPGGFNDPTIRATQEVDFYNYLGWLLFKVNATGIFNYILGGDITGISPASSFTTGYSGVATCVQETLHGGEGSTLGYVQENGGGAAPDCPITDWYQGWPGFTLNSLDGSITFNTDSNGGPPGNSGTSLGCGCYGVTFSFPTP